MAADSYARLECWYPTKASAKDAALAAVCAGAVATNLDPTTSIYRWEEEVKSVEEWHLSATTPFDIAPEVARCLVEGHPYKVPSVMCSSVSPVNPDMKKWMAEESKRESVMAKLEYMRSHIIHDHSFEEPEPC